MTPGFEYSFPAIRGLQAGREFFVSMCPLRLIPKLFIFDDEELPAELRAQRVLNRARVPEITQYILGNRDSYTFSAITASVDGNVEFEPMPSVDPARRMGVLRISMEARLVINDGQHRRAAIEESLRIASELGDESIAVVFFLDGGLERSQQMFADLNRYAVKPSSSIGVLYDHREELSQVVKAVVFGNPLYRDLVETERATLSAKSRKLFTLSAIYAATRALLEGVDVPDGLNGRAALASRFWSEVASHFPDWTDVRAGRQHGEDVRRDRIHTHALVLQAIGHVGNDLLKRGGDWTLNLARLASIDWARSNPEWEGKATINGRVSKARENVAATTEVLRGVLLSPAVRGGAARKGRQ
jgi:DNA sulfur modification protein DndB